MKTLKKALVTGLVAVMMVVNLAGCGKFDAAAYVESCLDLLTKGETEQYMKMTGRSKEQAESDYESNIDAMMTEMDQFNLSDELSNSYRQLFKDVYAKAKYTVKDAEKMDDKDGYYVTVEIEQMTGLFNGIQEELMTEFTEWANSFDADTYPTEDEMYEQMSACCDTYRQPYARVATTKPRRTSFCATVNPQEFLNDETGSRRWIRHRHSSVI